MALPTSLLELFALIEAEEEPKVVHPDDQKGFHRRLRDVGDIDQVDYTTPIHPKIQQHRGDVGTTLGWIKQGLEQHGTPEMKRIAAQLDTVKDLPSDRMKPTVNRIWDLLHTANRNYKKVNPQAAAKVDGFLAGLPSMAKSTSAVGKSTASDAGLYQKINKGYVDDAGQYHLLKRTEVPTGMEIPKPPKKGEKPAAQARPPMVRKKPTEGTECRSESVGRSGQVALMELFLREADDLEEPDTEAGIGLGKPDAQSYTSNAGAEAGEYEELPKEGKWRDELPGGLADRKKPSDFDRKELEKGAKVEREHTSDPHKAMEIAMDHLSEDPHYYEKLAKMEKEGRMHQMEKMKLTEVFALTETSKSSSRSEKNEDFDAVGGGMYEGDDIDDQHTDLEDHGQIEDDGDLDEKHLGFKKLKNKLSHKKGVHNPGALAAYIGREKYGAKGMAKKAAAGKK